MLVKIQTDDTYSKMLVYNEDQSYITEIEGDLFAGLVSNLPDMQGPLRKGFYNVNFIPDDRVEKDFKLEVDTIRHPNPGW